MTTKLIRDKILERLKGEADFDCMVVCDEINGNYFSAIDIAMPKNKDCVHVFRLMIVKHG